MSIVISVPFKKCEHPVMSRARVRLLDEEGEVMHDIKVCSACGGTGFKLREWRMRAFDPLEAVTRNLGRHN